MWGPLPKHYKSHVDISLRLLLYMYKKSSHLKNKVLPKKKTREAVGPSKVDSSIPLTTAV